MRRRVVVTGLGAVTSFGAGVEKLWEGLSQGRTTARTISRFDASGVAGGIAAEVDEIPATDWGSCEGRVMAMARAAAEEAWSASALKKSAQGLGLSLGWETENVPEDGSRRILSRGREDFLRRFSIGGQAFSCFSACAAGTQLVEEGARIIRRNEADVLLLGAADSRVHPAGFLGYARLGALAQGFDHEPAKASRPFDRARSGFVMGEGAGFLVLEEREHARKRGAVIYGEILGAASTCDAWSITAPREDGLAAAESIRRCLERAGVGSEELDYVNAHGTGTPANDRAEVKALEAALGESARKVKVGSFKSMIGHLAMASGIVEIVGSLLAMEQGIIPPNVNLEDPEFGLHFAGPTAEKYPLRKLLKTSFGFGGQNSSVLLGSPQA